VTLLPAPHRRPRVCALALVLALAPGPARAAPSERDLAYERALAAEEAGDHTRAAAAFERAYSLTAPGESGPRLLFLRAVITAHLRADDGTEAGRSHLCRARELLQGHLGDAPPTTPDPLAEERARLSEVETRLGGADCSPLEPATPATPAAPTPEPRPTATQQPGVAPSPAPSPVPTAIVPRPERPRTRALWIAGGLGLGLGAASFALMGAGVVLGRRASENGETACRDEPEACNSNSSTIRDIVAEGRRSEQFVAAGATLGGLAVIAGVTLLAVAARRVRHPARVTLLPRLAPGSLGLGLSGRF
jgi:hypothetical protein